MCRGSSKTNCLNNQQVKTLQAIYSGAVTNGNAPLYPGYMASDPGGPDGWAEWITGFVSPHFGVANPWGSAPTSLEVAPFQWSFQDQFMKYFVFDDPTYDSLVFNFSHKVDVGGAQDRAVQAAESVGEDRLVDGRWSARGQHPSWLCPARPVSNRMVRRAVHGAPFVQRWEFPPMSELRTNPSRHCARRHASHGPVTHSRKSPMETPSEVRSSP
jgi:hypothetical protein